MSNAAMYRIDTIEQDDEWQRWFPFKTYELWDTDNENVVFCFHHAGGSASVYRKWTLKKGKLNFVCVELPGKGTRRKERFINELDLLMVPLCKSIKQVVGSKKFYFFGHSMGAIIAFHAAAYLKEQYDIQPAKIVIAGRQAPNEVCPNEFNTSMDDNALITELKHYQATPKELLENKEFLSLVLPDIRKDYALNESYVYQGECVDAPLVLHSGKEDEGADAAIMAHWKEVTTSSIKVREFEGNHFFVLNLGEQYWNDLVNDLLKE